MCGRYSLYQTDKLESRFGASNPGTDLVSSYNVAPGIYHPVIIPFSQSRIIYPMKWGLIPSWAQDDRLGNKLINARAETISTKPSFKKSLQRYRCLVPANGFFEWQQQKTQKIPYYFFSSQMDLISFAGIYDIWESPDGSPIFSYSIITCDAPNPYNQIHNRMPLVLDLTQEKQWLSPHATSNNLHRILESSPLTLKYHVVPSSVNSATVDGPRLIQPI